MLKNRLLHIITLLTALLFAVGCAVDDGGDVNEQPKYGSLQLGEEQIPVNLAVVSESEDWLLVVLSPLTDTSNLTTNAIIGLRKVYLGQEVDIEYKYSQDDYILVYEDPTYYHAPYRKLQSGTMKMSMSGDRVSIRVNVVLFDGTPFVYSNDNIPAK